MVVIGGRLLVFVLVLVVVLVVVLVTELIVEAVSISGAVGDGVRDVAVAVVHSLVRRGICVAGGCNKEDIN